MSLNEASIKALQVLVGQKAAKLWVTKVKSQKKSTKSASLRAAQVQFMDHLQNLMPHKFAAP